LSDSLISPLIIAVQEFLNEIRDVNPRRTTQLTGRLLTLEAIGCQPHQITTVTHPAMLEDGPIDLVIPNHAAGHLTITHQLGTGTASDTDFVPIEFPFGYQVFGKIRIRKPHSAAPDDLNFSLFH
jgi:hypothetical protein